MLTALQHAFWNYLTNPSQDTVWTTVAAENQARAIQRLDVYRHAYWQRQLESLREDYPRLANVLDADFEQTAREYLQQHPSRSFSLRDLGRRFPDWLATRHQSTPIIELAEFERAMMDAFDAGDARVLTAEFLADIAVDDWPQLQMTPHPASRLLLLHSNAPTYWGAEPDSGCALALHPEPLDWLIWRSSHTVYFRSLDSTETWAWLQMGSTCRFDDWCERLTQRWPEEEVPGRAVGWLLRWANDGCLQTGDTVSPA